MLATLKNARPLEDLKAFLPEDIFLPHCRVFDKDLAKKIFLKTSVGTEKHNKLMGLLSLYKGVYEFGHDLEPTRTKPWNEYLNDLEEIFRDFLDSGVLREPRKPFSSLLK